MAALTNGVKRFLSGKASTLDQIVQEVQEQKAKLDAEVRAQQKALAEKQRQREELATVLSRLTLS